MIRDTAIYSIVSDLWNGHHCKIAVIYLVDVNFRYWFRISETVPINVLALLTQCVSTCTYIHILCGNFNCDVCRGQQKTGKPGTSEWLSSCWWMDSQHRKPHVLGSCFIHYWWRNSSQVGICCEPCSEHTPTWWLAISCLLARPNWWSWKKWLRPSEFIYIMLY